MSRMSSQLIAYDTNMQVDEQYHKERRSFCQGIAVVRFVHLLASPGLLSPPSLPTTSSYVEIILVFNALRDSDQYGCVRNAG